VLTSVLVLLLVAISLSLPSLAGVYAHSVVTKSTAQSGKQIIGAPGRPDRSSVISFSESPRREAAPGNPEDVAEPEPKPQGKLLPVDALVQKEGDRSGPGQGLLAPSPAPSSSFQALADNNNQVPPDTQGAVGRNQMMVTLNSQVSVQTRTGGTIGTTSLTGFWSSLGYSNVFDPRVLYDRYSDRWIFVALADYRTASSAVLVSVSQTSDPSGSWRLYGIDVIRLTRILQTIQ